MEGGRLRVAFLQEAPALGSDLEVGKLTADARVYRRGLAETHAVAVRAGGGTTFGQPSFVTSFAVGGFPDGSLFDVARTNHSVLRGYRQDAFTGRRFAHANVEYRVPLLHPQRGHASLPFFLRHVHAAVFADAAHAWTRGFALSRVQTGAGAALGVDLAIAHGVPLTATAGVAHGFAAGGDTRAYLRFGLAY